MQAEPEERKAIWRDAAPQAPPLPGRVRRCCSREDGEANGDLVREMIIMALPRENYEEMFDTMVRWARFGNLFAYEDDADRLSLQ